MSVRVDVEILVEVTEDEEVEVVMVDDVMEVVVTEEETVDDDVMVDEEIVEEVKVEDVADVVDVLSHSPVTLIMVVHVAVLSDVSVTMSATTCIPTSSQVKSVLLRSTRVTPHESSDPLSMSLTLST